uniref:Histamine H1 receptor n=1 Tax=Tetraodon nigroviridis TaxID=99883 RepID=H3DBF5_TETNG
GLLSLVTVIMNVLVLCAVKKEKSLHTVGNLYIVSLSVADLIVGTTVMPLNLVYLLEDEWKLGRAVCLFWLVMDYVASTASIFSLFILCLDRYRSVRQPLKYLKYRTWEKASAMIAGAWLLSMLWIIPILGWRSFTHVELKPEEENKCDTDFRFVTWFKIVTAVFNFYVPSVLMLWFYRHIYMAVRQHLRDRGRIIHPTDSFEENENGQNAHTFVSEHKLPENGCDIAKELSKTQCVIDHQTCPSEEGDKTRKVSFRSHRKIGVKGQHTSFLAIKGGQLRLVQKVKSCSLTSEKKSQDVVCSTGDAEARLPAPFHDNHDSGPKLLTGVCDNFIGQSCHRIQSLKIHKEYKAAKQLGFIIFAFFLCWIPYFITFMVMAFCRDCVHHELHMFTIWLGYINSTLNPFIYPLCNRNFKRVFKNFLKIRLFGTRR